MRVLKETKVDVLKMFTGVDVGLDFETHNPKIRHESRGLTGMGCIFIYSGIWGAYSYIQVLPS